MNFLILLTFFVSSSFCIARNQQETISVNDTILVKNDSSILLILNGNLIKKLPSKKMVTKTSSITIELFKELWKFLLGLVSGILVLVFTRILNNRRQLIDEGTKPIKKLLYKIRFRFNIWNYKKKTDEFILDLSDWALSFSLIDEYYQSLVQKRPFDELDGKITPLLTSINDGSKYIETEQEIKDVISYTDKLLEEIKKLEKLLKLPLPKFFIIKIFTKKIKWNEDGKK